KRDNPGGTEGNLNGALAELIVYDAALDDAARSQVEQALCARYGVVPYEAETLVVTRVIPGDHAVTVDWLAPDLPAIEAYVVEVKLRYAPWEEAVATRVPSGDTSTTCGGLMNHADYAVRVAAVDAAGARLASSGPRLMSPAEAPGVTIDYIHQDESHFLSKGVYVGSPSIARLPDGRFVASHDLFGCGSYDFSRVFRSADGGATWQHVADVEQAFWGTLFVHRGTLYLIACSERFGDIVLHASKDGGETWQRPAVLASGEYHKAPVPVTHHDGRLWCCVELHDCPGWSAVALSVPEDADLMAPANWTVSAPLGYSAEWQPEGWNPQHAHISEGNAVVDPAGNLLDILRYNPPPHSGKAVVLDIAPDGRTLQFSHLMELNGSLTKFTIRRHPDTGVYWALVNRVPEPRDGLWAVRNILTLVRSDDLEEWTPVYDVLRDDRKTAPQYTGFQYIDWLFDGDDIVFVSRTAYNGAHTFHDANHLTFHRIEGFATLPHRVGP
ncbi:MAG: exo-alpha-sialidase, partial [Candidatus Hydrogenedentes bacterium]|nr:exo-alpha-sialidase [Candidatus Hydrogenedentota bacterium]